MISQKHFVGFVYHKDSSKATYYDNTQKTDEAAFSLTEMRERAKKMGAARAFPPDSDFVKWIRRNS